MWPEWMLEYDVSQQTLDSLYKKNILSPEQQQVNVGFWSPENEAASSAAGTWRCPLSQLPVPILHLSFFLFGHISSLIRRHLCVETRNITWYYCYLCWFFRQNVWSNEVGLQKEQTLKILFLPPSNSSSLTSPSTHLSLSCLTYKSDRRWTAS